MDGLHRMQASVVIFSFRVVRSGTGLAKMSENGDGEPPMKVVRLSELQESVESLVQMALEKTAAASGPSATIAGGGKPVIFPGSYLSLFPRDDGTPRRCPSKANFLCMSNVP